ncbi:SUKH-4 family immunity protein [Streptomyces sp. NPDC046332]|uniref:SUKH-4 family immunity protein n=1 Tax=Streptomyces sp. NPDC046332 TaxID=3155133 RepID=UPI0033D2030F
MLIDVHANQVLSRAGLTGLTYYPQHPGSRMHPDTARFLATVGLPSNKLFSAKLDLHAHRRLECQPSLKAAFDADGATLPKDASHWEIIGEFQYAMVVLDPRTGKVYSFAEGEEFHVPMHQDVSSLAHALTCVETGLADLKKLPHAEDRAREEVIERLRNTIDQADDTPLASVDSVWSKFFDEISFGMWG